MGAFTDRSRILCHQSCPRARYFQYEIYGHGVRRATESIPLVTGQQVHTGRAALLLGKPVGEAVHLALAEYDRTLADHGFHLRDGEAPGPVVLEQRALIEALIRGYAICLLPALLNRYEVIAVEPELSFPLGSLTFMSRPDAILRNHETGDLYVDSLKTAGIGPSDNEFRKFEEEGRHDDQGISEVVAVEHAYNERVMGVRMEYLLKGPRREYPDDSGQYVQWSPLIRGYCRLGVTEAENEYATNWKYKGEDGRNHTLGKGWERVNMWETDMGVAGWISWLAENDRATLEKQFRVPMTFFRNSEEVELWKRQRTASETRIADSAASAEDERVNGGRIDFIEVLDEEFPQHRRSCDRPSSCQFLEICFGAADPADPLASGGFVPRKPHHAPELLQLSAASVIQRGDEPALATFNPDTGHFEHETGGEG